MIKKIYIEKKRFNRDIQAIKQSLLAFTIASCEVPECHSVQVQESTQLCSRAALRVHSSTPQLSRSSLSPFGLRISLERTAFILLCCIFLCSLRAPVFCTNTLLGSLVSFCTLYFSLLFLQWNTGSVSG